MFLLNPVRRPVSFFAATLGLTALLALSGSIAAHAQSAKPAPKKPVVPAKPAIKPAASKADQAIVLGTTQMEGDFGKFGTTYTIGKSEPINFTLQSAEYSIVPFVMGEETWVPKADQKLLILHYTVHNPMPKEQRYSWNGVKFTAVDAKDNNSEMLRSVGRDGTTEVLDLRLKPAQKINVVAAILVPAKDIVPKLIVSREEGAPVIRYDLHDKVKALPAEVADSADPTGATVKNEIPAQPGTVYAMGAFYTRLDEVAYVSGALNGHAPGANKRFLTGVFTIKNRTNLKQRYYWGDFIAVVRDANGDRSDYTESLLKAGANERAEGHLMPGEEVRVRFFGAVPSDVAAKTLLLRECKEVQKSESRPFAFDVSQSATGSAVNK